jgi:hypothetical protein
MASFTVRVGLLLIVFGIASYVTTGGVSVTALIPSVFGALLAALGLVAVRQERARRHALHAAAVVAFLGLIGTASALGQLPGLADGSVARRPAVVARSGMALLLLVYLGFSVKSFVDARLRRKV